MPVLGPDCRHSERLNRVINFVQTNCHTRLELDALAEVACLSKFHFSRVFHDRVEESPVKFIKRTRLERAASILSNPTKAQVKEVAYLCGFSSNQLFSREFGSWFGQSPREFRETFKRGNMGSVPDVEGSGQKKPVCSGVEVGQIEVVKLQPTAVAYVRSFGNYGTCDKAGQAISTVSDWSMAQKAFRQDAAFLGVSWDFPFITPDGRCRFDACVSLPDDAKEGAGMSRQVIPGGFYATAEFEYRRASDLIDIWRGFTLTLCTAPAFRHLKADVHQGPWFEKYAKAQCDDLYRVKLFSPVRLGYRAN